jgi:hypothetical protein
LELLGLNVFICIDSAATDTIKMKDITEKEEILQFLKENKQDLLSEFKLVKIGLFGSFARDAAN